MCLLIVFPYSYYFIVKSLVRIWELKFVDEMRACVCVCVGGCWLEVYLGVNLAAKWGE